MPEPGMAVIKLSPPPAPPLFPAGCCSPSSWEGQSCSSSSLRFGKARQGLAQNFPVLSICNLGFAVSISGEQRTGWEFSSMTGRLPRALQGKSARPALPSPSLALVFPFFPSLRLSQALGELGICVFSSGADPNSCTWPWCTARSRAGEAGKTTQEYPKSPGTSKPSQDSAVLAVL